MRIVLVIVGPALAFLGVAWLAATSIGMLAFLSAMGHGSLTRSEAMPFMVVGVVCAVGAGVAATAWCERRAFGPRAERTDEDAATTSWTRAASAALAGLTVAGVVVLPSAADRTIATTRARYAPDVDVRVDAIGALSRRSASSPSDFLGFVDDPSPDVRAAAGSALVGLAQHDAAWSAVERLVRSDPSPVVRERVLAELAARQSPPSRATARARLLEDLLKRTDAPATVLGAARGLGHDGAATARALVMDVSQLDGTRIEAIQLLGQLKDRESLDLLRDIMTGRVAPGLIAPARETGYRAAASEAIGRIAPYEREDWMMAFDLERLALGEVVSVASAQAKYRDASGFFDRRLECLELPSTCVAGRDPDESFLGPALVSQLPRRGYARRFHPGPPAPPDDARARGASPSSSMTFAYVAVPEVPFETGVRAFCVDDRGICFTRDGTAPVVRNGRCPEGVPFSEAVPPVYSYHSGGPEPLECAR